MPEKQVTKIFRLVIRQCLRVGACLLIFLVLLGIWEFSLASFKSLPPKDAEITRSGGHLRDDGFPDYAKALEEHLLAGKDSNQNCVIPLVHLIGPEFMPDHVSNEFYERLGTERPKETNTVFRDWHKHAKSLEGPSREEFESSKRIVSKEPWKPADHPEAARWIQVNQPLLAKIQSIADHDQFFFPFVYLEGKESAVEFILLTAAQELWSISRYLKCHALMAIAENDWDRAATDSEVIWKFAYLVDQGAFTIEGMIANALRESVFKIEKHLVNKASWPEPQIKKRLEYFERWAPQPMFAERLNWAERFMILEAVRTGIRGELDLGVERAKVGPFGKPKQIFRYLDVKTLYQSINDRIDHIIETSDPNQPDNLIQENRQRAAWALREKRYLTNWRMWSALLRGRKARAEMIADILISVRMLDLEDHIGKEQKNMAYSRLIQAGWSMKLFKSKNNRLPDSLSELNTQIHLSSTIDPFTGQSLSYRRDGEMAQVYARGVNIRDETQPQLSGSGYENEPPYVIENTTNDDIHMTLELGVVRK